MMTTDPRGRPTERTARLDPITAMGIEEAFPKRAMFAKIANVSPHRLGQMLRNEPGRPEEVAAVTRAWEVCRPDRLRDALAGLPHFSDPEVRVAVGALIEALDAVYGGVFGEELL